MITGSLDSELARSLEQLATDTRLPAPPEFAKGAWRPAPGADPASYAIEVAKIAATTGHSSRAELAAALAQSFRALPWVQAAAPTGDGYLTITVTPQALAGSAARMATAGLACANSTVLRGSTAMVRPWPDMAAAPSWQRAWQEQAEAMTGRLAQAAGATVTFTSERERGSHRTTVVCDGSPVKPAVAYFGVSSVRYRLARTLPGNTARLEQLSQVSSADEDPLHPVQQAHAAAASALRWAAELGLERDDPGERLAGLLSAPSERSMLGLLSWLPVRVAAAARRHRPFELPRYLEQVSAAWLTCRQASPALPFGGQSAPADPATLAARLVLADAVRAVLSAGLALTGIVAIDRL